ncbi:hypothetical protein HY285_01055 [Candidatus Peregrinibacteria bacterium]|nr:hypothetical protein [Candidatus Peregrinibacteria bacterium]MBI3816115.1 hypothetical protein [Candidatus Peregrinibacteria bacterium]
MRRSEHIARFQEIIWEWFAIHKRTLPWRDLRLSDDTERAYRILVSEVMLQQTQVSRVKVAYVHFLERFPHLEDLASASNRDALIAWRGMGYNSRALRLRDAARTIEQRFGGIFPCEMGALQSIEGLGHYTAAAIRNFAFNLPTPCLDTNIRRILHRVFVGPENTDGTWRKDDGYVLRLAREILEIALHQRIEKRKTPAHRSPPAADEVGRNEKTISRDTKNWHAALMDFGSLVCTKRDPQWDICPLTQHNLMKTTPRNFPKSFVRNSKAEPGRAVGSTFIPNRIFRGRVIEELRDNAQGLTLRELGPRIAIDWNPAHHREWLRELVEKLKRDRLVEERECRYVLAS